MGLKEDLADLYALQRADSDLEALARELAALENGSRAAKRAEDLEAARQAAEARLKESEARLRDRELALESAEAERKQKWQRAYGGTVADPKELAALERKIEELDRRKGLLEEEILELYDTVERLRKEQAEAQRRAEEGALRAKQARAHYLRRSKEICAEREALQRRREELIGRLPPELLQEYQKLGEKREGVAVAAIVEGTCDFCRTRTPNEYILELQKPERLVHCESCGRILVLAP